VIEAVDDVRAHDRREVVEIHDHPGRRAARLQRPRNGDLEAIRVTVQASALSGVERQDVRRLEPERFTNDHDSEPFGVTDVRSGWELPGMSGAF
jgi:hypothetical protein